MPDLRPSWPASTIRISSGGGASLSAGDGTRLELVEPASDASPINACLDKRGSGLHHVAFEVADVAAAIEVLVARGVRMIDTAPRPGAHRTTVAFVHPKSMCGGLTELVQPPADDAR